MRAFRMPKSSVDDRKIEKDEPLRRRTRWAINYVTAEKGITNKDLGEVVGINHATVSSYRVMNTSPKARFINEFCKIYGFNEAWFLNGVGEPFAGACLKYPDICGPEDERPDHARHTEPPSVSESPPPYTDNLSIADDLTKTARVLESKTPYATALHLLLNSLHRAIEVEAKHSDINKRFDALQNRLSDVEKRNDELSREVIILRGQLLGGEDTSSETG